MLKIFGTFRRIVYSQVKLGLLHIDVRADEQIQRTENLKQ